MFRLENIRVIDPGGKHDFPLTVRAPRSGYRLADWLASESARVWSLIHLHGAILFRGFSLGSVRTFENAVLSLTKSLTHEYGDLPASLPGTPFVRNVTPYPPEHAILFHNEGTHTPRWPLYQWFYCESPPVFGGETPLVLCDSLYDSLPPAQREKFEKLGLRYVRNFIKGFDIPWQKFFRTSDPRIVDCQCAELGSTCSWEVDGSLRISINRPAVLRHVERQHPVFCNQVLLHHPACLDADARAEMLHSFGSNGLPRTVSYGDGTPIPDSTITDVLAAAIKLSVCFSWQADDVLMIDNVAVAHARRPYTGTRRMYVALSRFTGDLESVESAAHL